MLKPRCFSLPYASGRAHRGLSCVLFFYFLFIFYWFGFALVCRMPPPLPTPTPFFTDLRLFEFCFYFSITKTYLYNFDPLKPHFYIVKLGFTGICIISLISAQKHRLWVLVRTASLRRFKRIPIFYVLSRNMKNIRIFYLKMFIFLW